MPQLLTLPLDHVSPAAEGQVRQHFDVARLQSLADSLKPEFDGKLGPRGTRLKDFGHLAAARPKNPRHTT